jgi:hypothetical protein
MVREGYVVKPKPLTEEERERLKDIAKELFALREETYQRTGRIDVAALIRRARGVEE